MGDWGREEDIDLTGGNTLDPASARETADGGFGDALDVVAQDFAVAFGAAFAEAFAAFSACGWGEEGLVRGFERRGRRGIEEREERGRRREERGKGGKRREEREERREERGEERGARGDIRLGKLEEG